MPAGSWHRMAAGLPAERKWLFTIRVVGAELDECLHQRVSHA
jgi:hypothetical protein